MSHEGVATKVVVVIESGSSLLARAAAITAMGVDPESVVSAYDEAGNVIQLTAYVAVGNLPAVRRALSSVSGVQVVSTPELGSLSSTVHLSLSGVEEHAAQVEGELLAVQANVSNLEVGKAAKVSAVSTADATDLSSALALANELKAKIDAMNA